MPTVSTYNGVARDFQATTRTDMRIARADKAVTHADMTFQRVERTCRRGKASFACGKIRKIIGIFFFQRPAAQETDRSIILWGTTIVFEQSCSGSFFKAASEQVDCHDRGILLLSLHPQEAAKSMAKEISEQQIKKHFYTEYFERGLDYYENGRIIDPVFHGNRLEASCEGSTPEPYRLSATLKAGGIADNQCTCPLGGDCKHVIALLLTWVRDRKRFFDLAGLEKRLGEKSREELLETIKRLLETKPGLAWLIQEPASRKKGRKTAVDPETFRARIRNAMDRYDGWRAMGTVTDAIGSVMGAAAAFLKNKDFKNARIVYDALIRETLAGYESVQDEGEISMEIEAATEALAVCLADNGNDGDERLKIVETLFEIIRWDITKGGYGMGENVPKILSRRTSPDERRRVITWGAAALRADASDGHKEEWGRFLKELYDVDGDDTGFLAFAEGHRLYELLFEKLVELKDIDRALETASGVRTACPSGFSFRSRGVRRGSVPRVHRCRIAGMARGKIREGRGIRESAGAVLADVEKPSRFGRL
jgi:hypothetical protein